MCSLVRNACIQPPSPTKAGRVGCNALLGDANFCFQSPRAKSMHWWQSLAERQLYRHPLLVYLLTQLDCLEAHGWISKTLPMPFHRSLDLGSVA